MSPKQFREILDVEFVHVLTESSDQVINDISKFEEYSKSKWKKKFIKPYRHVCDSYRQKRGRRRRK